jgi:hypothetical protein
MIGSVPYQGNILVTVSRLRDAFTGTPITNAVLTAEFIDFSSGSDTVLQSASFSSRGGGFYTANLNPSRILGQTYKIKVSCTSPTSAVWEQYVRAVRQPFLPRT